VVLEFAYQILGCWLRAVVLEFTEMVVDV